MREFSLEGVQGEICVGENSNPHGIVQLIQLYILN